MKLKETIGIITGLAILAGMGLTAHAGYRDLKSSVGTHDTLIQEQRVMITKNAETLQELTISVAEQRTDIKYMVKMIEKLDRNTHG